MRDSGAREPLLHILRWGDEQDERLPIAVLLHGGAANAHWWDHLAPRFSDRFRLVALDFRGHGDSEHPKHLRSGAFNEDLEALLAHLGRRDVVLIGASMGAHIAMEHAARCPQVRALVLLDPSRPTGGDSRHARRFRLALSLRSSYATREEAVRRYGFLPPARGTSEALRRAIAEHSVSRNEDGRWGYKFDPRWFRLTTRSRPELERIRCPTLIVRGEHSRVLTPEGALALCNEIGDPEVELAVIAGAGHHVQLDRPDEVAECLTRFFDRAVATQPTLLEAEPGVRE